MTLTKNNDAANKTFWIVASEARIQVETKWPEWKRSVRVTKYSRGFSVKQNNSNGNSLGKDPDIDD